MTGRYIIFADDDADDLELITGFFKQYNQNVNVLMFSSGKDVVRFLEDFALATNPPLLVVLDINMPGMNGLETLETIREHPRYMHIPVVIYTTSTNQADQDLAHKLGASWATKSHSIEIVKQTAKVLAEFCQLQKSY